MSNETKTVLITIGLILGGIIVLINSKIDILPQTNSRNSKIIGVISLSLTFLLLLILLFNKG